MRVRVVLLGALVTGCYLSHESDVPPLDAGGRVDAGVVRPDAVVPTIDAGPVTTCPRFDVVASRSIVWTDDEGCSLIQAPVVVARGAGFDLVVTEARTCRDRPSEVWLRRLVSDGSGLAETASGVLPAGGPATVATAAQSELALCSGLRWWALTEDYAEIASGRLADEPVSLPGCPMRNECMGVAGGPEGYLVSFELFECDVSGYSLARYDRGGVLLGEPFVTFEPIADVAAFDDGFAAAARPRGSPSTRAAAYLFRSGASRPTELTLEGLSEGDAAVAPWPFLPGHLAFVFSADDGMASSSWLDLVVVDPSGREVLRRRVDPFAGTDTRGFGGASVAVAATRHGLVVATSVEWMGGALRAMWSAVLLGEGGDAVGPPIVRVAEGEPTVLGLAADDEHALVHVARSGTETEAVLLGCL